MRISPSLSHTAFKTIAEQAYVEPQPELRSEIVLWTIGNLRSYDGCCNEMELCVGLSGLRLFYVNNVVQNRRRTLSLAWHEWFSCKGKDWKVYCCGLALSSEPQKWKFHVVIWHTTSKLHQKACRTCSTIIFPHSTNQIIHLCRCHCRSCRHFFHF